MSLVVGTNVSALYSQNAMKTNARSTATTMERLSTGVRVNSAKDDAAGLAIGQSMTAQIRGLDQAVRNINDGINLIQTADGGLNSISQALQRMRELAVQSSNGSYSDTQRAYLEQENAALQTEINNVISTTTWNGQNLLDGTFTDQILQVGADVDQSMPITIPSAQLSTMGAYNVSTTQQFPNANFNTGVAGSNSIEGWTLVNQRVLLDGTSTVAGWPTPIDSTTAPDGGIESASGSGSFTTQLSASTSSGSGLSVVMASSLGGVTNNPTGSGGVLHGPALYSNTSIALNPGDTITFDWMAQGGSDAFDVFAYILDTQTGHTEQLLNTTGASASYTQPWTTVSHTVTSAGNYQYVFISGSWDATRGQAAGAQLFVDNINASSTTSESTTDRIDISTVTLASSALSAIDLGINAINASRANLGSYINRLAYAADNATNISSNATQSRSTIIDADYAIETTNLAKNQIIQQAATAMLAQANQQSKAVVALLKNLYA